MKDNTAAVHAQVPVDVATFLLNEKRAEIHEIESRFRTSIMLIPNIHLETPNYSVIRLRTDEAGEVETPSYRMVEMPAEVAEEKTPSAEAKPQRQMAAVRGITPGQPAPIVAEDKAKITWFAKVKNWFQNLGGGQEEKELPKPKTRPMKSEKRREPREARRERDSERTEPRRERGERGEGRGAQQKPRVPTPQATLKKETTVAQEAAPSIPATEKTGTSETQEPRSRRGRRGGRRERGERQETSRVPQESAMFETASATEAVTSSPKEIISEAVPAEAHVAQPVAAPVAVQEAVVATEIRLEVTQPAAEMVPPTPVEPAQSPLTEAAEIVASAPPAEIAAAAASPTVKEESKPRVPRRRAPQAVLQERSVAASGLIQVETSPDKVKPVSVETPEANEPLRPRPRRAPRPKVVDESAPLVQIETRK